MAGASFGESDVIEFEDLIEIDSITITGTMSEFILTSPLIGSSINVWLLL